MILRRRHPSLISLPFLYFYNLLLLSFYLTTTTYYVNAQQSNHCFEDRDELKAAIDLYVADDCSNNSNCTQAFQDSSIGFPMNTWCTSLVTDFSNLFDGMGTFNEDISRWDTSNVTTMTKTFWYAYSFNGNIKNWDVSNVKDMSWMFGRAQSFDTDISSWNTGNVESMQAMFYFSLRFNQPIGVWDVSSVENFYGMFIGAESFNQDLSSWSMTSATDTENMFQEATAFDFDLYAPESVTLEPTTASPTAKPTMSPVTMKPTTSPSKQVVVPSPPANDNDCLGHTLDVSITLDQYPADTRWEIIPTMSKAAVATSPAYDLTLQFKPAEVDRICLEEGSYDFNIYDVYGDGICCGWGEGSYQLAFGDVVVASGGAFGKEETKEFSTPVAVPTTESPTKPPQSTKPTASPQTTPQTTDKPSLPPQIRAPVTDPVTVNPTVSQTTQRPTTSRQQAGGEEDTEEVSRPIEQPKPDEVKEEEEKEEETCPEGFRLGGVVDECRVCGNKEISCTKMSYTGGADALFEPPGCACTLCDTQFQCNFLEVPTESDAAGIVVETPPMNSAPRCHLTRVGNVLVILFGLLSVM